MEIGYTTQEDGSRRYIRPFGGGNRLFVITNSAAPRSLPPGSGVPRTLAFSMVPEKIDTTSRKGVRVRQRRKSSRSTRGNLNIGRIGDIPPRFRVVLILSLVTICGVAITLTLFRLVVSIFSVHANANVRGTLIQVVMTVVPALLVMTNKRFPPPKGLIYRREPSSWVV